MEEVKKWIEKAEKDLRTARVNKRILKLCRKLNPHYIETRYPIGIEYTEGIAKQALKDSEEVVRWVRKKVER